MYKQMYFSTAMKHYKRVGAGWGKGIYVISFRGTYDILQGEWICLRPISLGSLGEIQNQSHETCSNGLVLTSTTSMYMWLICG